MTAPSPLTAEILTLSAEFGDATRNLGALADDREAASLAAEDAEAAWRAELDKWARFDRLHAAAVARLNEARDRLVAATRAADPAE